MSSDGDQQVCQSGRYERLRHQETLIWPQKSSPDPPGQHNHQPTNGNQQGSKPGTEHILIFS